MLHSFLHFDACECIHQVKNYPYACFKCFISHLIHTQIHISFERVDLSEISVSAGNHYRSGEESAVTSFLTSEEGECKI